MEYCKSEALAIKCVDYRESSQIVTFYTRDYGKVNILARGAKLKRYDWEGPFDLLTHCQIVYIPSLLKQTNILTNSKIYDNFIVLHYDYDKLKYGMAVVEFLNEITAVEDRNPGLFQLTLATLNKICSEARNIKVVFFTFQIHALKSLGYLSYQNLEVNALPAGIIPKDDSKGVFALVRSLLKAKIPLQHLRISQEMSEKLYRFLNSYIAHIIGHELKIKLYENKDSFTDICFSRANSR